MSDVHFLNRLTAFSSFAAVEELVVDMVGISVSPSADSKGCHADELFALAKYGHTAC